MKRPAMLYYFPARSGLRRVLCRMGLWRLVIPGRLRRRFPLGSPHAGTAGPDGGIGLLATWQPGTAVVYDPAGYEWHRCFDHWRAFRRDYSPHELLRGGPLVPGRTIALGDGRLWEIPVAHGSGRQVNGDGSALSSLGRVVAMHAVALGSRIDAAGQLVMDRPDLHEACVRMIAVNYSVDFADCVLLGLLTPDGCLDIVRTLLGVNAIDTLRRAFAATEGAVASKWGGAGVECAIQPEQPA